MKPFKLIIDIARSYDKNNDNNLIIDVDGKEWPETESFINIGRKVFEHIIEIHKDENSYLEIDEYIENRVCFIHNIFKDLMFMLSERDFVFSFPDGKQLSGEEFREYLETASFEDVMHLGKEVQLFLKENMDVNVIVSHKTGFHAILFFYDLNLTVDQYFQYHEPSVMMEILNDLWIEREKMSMEIFSEEKKKENAKKAAKKRHSETASFKREILEIYDENKSQYKSVAEAARQLAKVVPVTDRTIDKWIRQNKKP